MPLVWNGAKSRLWGYLRALVYGLTVLLSGCQAGGELGDPPSPPHISVSPSDKSLRIEWPSVDGAGAYYLYRFDSSETLGRAVQSRQLVTSPLILDGLSNGTTYYLALTAVGQGGESAFSQVVAGTPQPPPPAPRNLEVSTGSGSLTLAWDDAKGAEKYRIYRVRGAEPLGGEFASAPGFEGLEEASTPSFSVGGLDNGVEYSFVVTAVNQSGESAPSAVITAIPGPVRVIAAGIHHACIVDGEARSSCWGRNDAGQLGASEDLVSARPVAVEGIKAWRLVATGDDYSCGVSVDEVLICWGGAGGMTITAEAPRGGSWRSISVSRNMGCGVQSDGVLWCWPLDGTHGGAILGGPVLQRIGIATDWLDVTISERNWCARKQDLTLWCWGDNTTGQLGNGSTIRSSTPVAVTSEQRFTQVAVGNVVYDYGSEFGLPAAGHACAIDTERALWCWGFNRFGQLGIGHGEDADSPQSIVASKPWVDVAAGESHTCGVQLDGTLWCWGSNEFGQLGISARVDHREPTRVGNESDWRRVVAGAHFTCAVKADGSVWCVGRNDYGQIGETAVSAYPEPAVILDDVKDFVVAQRAGCALRADRSTWCWGAIALPADDSQSRPYGAYHVPKLMPDLPAFSAVFPDKLVGGLCGLADDANDLYCLSWDYPTDVNRVPLTYPPLEFGSNFYSRCALLKTGELNCGFASNYLGGDGSVQVLLPVNTDKTWKELSVGPEFGCAIDADGELWCFGKNNGGALRLDEGIYVDSLPEPMQFYGGHVWRTVAVGNAHLCTVDDRGALWCAGINETGQLGIGADALFSDGLQRVDDGPWRQVRASNQATCGIKSDGSLWCWGSHAIKNLPPQAQWNGQSPVYLPERVGNATDWVDVDLGDGFGCGLRSGGKLHCWGLNNLGQVGDGKAWITQWSPVTFGEE